MTAAASSPDSPRPSPRRAIIRWSSPRQPSRLPDGQRARRTAPSRAFATRPADPRRPVPSRKHRQRARPRLLGNFLRITKDLAIRRQCDNVSPDRRGDRRCGRGTMVRVAILRAFLAAVSGFGAGALAGDHLARRNAPPRMARSCSVIIPPNRSRPARKAWSISASRSTRMAAPPAARYQEQRLSRLDTATCDLIVATARFHRSRRRPARASARPMTQSSGSARRHGQGGAGRRPSDRSNAEALADAT